MDLRMIRVRQEFDVELPWHRYTGSWQPDPDAPFDEFFSEDGPGWNDVDEAIRWGRRHAPVVLVRLGEGLREVYNAGERDDGEARGLPRWPGARRRPAANRQPGYGGVVYLGEEFPTYIPVNRFTAFFTDLDGRPLDRERRVFEELDQAIDWARERAELVLIAEAPSMWSGIPAYEIWSAGTHDPPGERLPRLRPRAGEKDLQWELRSQIATPTQRPDDYVEALQSALISDAQVIAARCAESKRPPRMATLPAVRATHEVSAEEHAALDTVRRRPDDDAWVDVMVRVRAATREAGCSTAIAAIDRARAAVGDHLSGWSSHGEIHQID
jgi:hypothetical protein